MKKELPGAPNFTRYLQACLDEVDGAYEFITEEVTQGYPSNRGTLARAFAGLEECTQPVDDDEFRKRNEKSADEIKGFTEGKPGKYFIGPFHTCLRTKILFRSPEIEGSREIDRPQDAYSSPFCIPAFTAILRAYPDFKDKDGKMPLLYKGFCPGLKRSNIGLVYGTFRTLKEVVHDFDIPLHRKKLGKTVNRDTWIRYDGWNQIPFP